MPKISTTHISLAGEFAVLSQLALRGYDANLTLSNTKGVDILVSNPHSGAMFRLEVKTNYNYGTKGGSKTLFGDYKIAWQMSEKHESWDEENLFYCFVLMMDEAKDLEFYIIPSKIVARYVRDEHQWWLKNGANRKTSKKRIFRIGTKSETYPISTPFLEDWKDNWDFRISRL